MMSGCASGRLASLPPLLLFVLFLGAFAPTKAADEDPFLTNLALLDVLAADAVEQVLDSLGVAPGDSIHVLADGYSEGNGFVADALVRGLTRRGCSVRMLAEASAALAESADEPAGGAPAETDSLPAGSDDEEKEQQVEAEEQTEQGEEDQQDDLEADLFDQELFADDSTSVSDSTLWGTPEDTLAADGGRAAQETAVEPKKAAPPQKTAPAPQPVAAGRIYPPGTILEFQVLEFGVTYPQIRRRFLFLGTASIDRLAGVYVQARRIEGPGGEIVEVASGQSHHQDRLSGRSRVLAEGAGYPFTAPTVPPGQIGKLAEPIVVVGIIASLVYLFYQNQN